MVNMEQADANVAKPIRTTLTASRESENPFVCNICKKSYTRVDHLARHHRSRKQMTAPDAPFLASGG